jgi:hypothetical protein
MQKMQKKEEKVRLQRQTLILNHKKKESLKGLLFPFGYFFLFCPLDMAMPKAIPIPMPRPMLSRAIPIANPLFEKLNVFFLFKLSSF